VLLQLQQMALARQSAEMPKKDHQKPFPLEVGIGDDISSGACEREGRSCNNISGHTFSQTQN
jgi:hypothetical protein